MSRPLSYLVAVFLPGISSSWLFLPVSFVVGGAALGALIGLPQWLLLKNWVPRASFWLLVNIAGYTLGQVLACICLMVSVGVNLPEELAGGIYIVILGVVSAVCSGGILERLLQHSTQGTR